MINTIPYLDTDGDNTAQALKTADGRILYLHVINPNATDAFLQLFDAATGDVTVGTTTPALTFLIPAGNGVTRGAWELPPGVAILFKVAITYACTTTATCNGDPTTGLIINALRQ